ncbi:MAG: FAD-binding oxidoreductase [Bacteroidales bacterium]|nr:FAD-binding oxidoreductase [Bacteroidales bacterium]
MAIIYNWGVYPKIDADLITEKIFNEIWPLIKNQSEVIPRGNGRCYGDSALQKTILSCLKLNKILHFDAEDGIVKCESGVLLSELLKFIVPKGFFLPVTPGTKFITIGGAIASNIHGKNHHKEGAISLHIESLELLTETGTILICSKESNKELFVHTIGGMGLTGIILTATLRLKRIESSYIRQKSIKAKNLDEIVDLFDKYNNYTYSVAWIDCLSGGSSLGRSVLMLGEHAATNELPAKFLGNPLKTHSDKQINVPFMFPSFALNKLTVSAFNFLFYNKQLKKEINNTIHYEPFFYPLDALNNWNRIYGKNGFTQYQFVLPFEKGKEGLTKILTKIAHSGCGSFLAVLKTFGHADDLSAPISFPKQGYTLALDFKINKKVLSLLDSLDPMVIDYGGRLYLTKDSRMSKKTFKETYPIPFKHPEKFNSLQSKRLEI